MGFPEEPEDILEVGTTGGESDGAEVVEVIVAVVTVEEKVDDNVEVGGLSESNCLRGKALVKVATTRTTKMINFIIKSGSSRGLLNERVLKE